MASEAELRDFGHLVCSLSRGKTMTRQETCEAYRQVILNKQPELQQGAFLMAHITRGPTTEELAGAWDALDLYDTAKVPYKADGPVCDIVGTGSDNLKTINCSTPAALIASACGLTIAKKGARLVTGVSGASDIMEILGVNLDAPLGRARASLHENGICYLPGEAFLKSGWARLIKSMRFTSAFNIIGPLTRPCMATDSIVIGGYSPEICDQLIEILKEIGIPRALAPYGMSSDEGPEMGMDEFSPCGPTRVVELRDGKIDTYEVTPEDFGMDEVHYEFIASMPTASDNAQVIMNVLKGGYDSPAAMFFCINAAAALYISDIVESYMDGYAMAMESLVKGKAQQKLDALIRAQGA